MPEGQADQDAFRPRHWELTRAELNRAIAQYFALERHALFATAAIWTALAATTNADWDPLVKWLPLVLNALFAFQAVRLALRIAAIDRQLVAAERHFVPSAELAPPGERIARGLNRLTASIFWLLLLAATAGLPFLYIERVTDADYENNPSLTDRYPPAAATPTAAIAARP